jgi:hypothetical protein
MPLPFGQFDEVLAVEEEDVGDQQSVRFQEQVIEQTLQELALGDRMLDPAIDGGEIQERISGATCHGQLHWSRRAMFIVSQHVGFAALVRKSRHRDADPNGSRPRETRRPALAHHLT